MTSTAGGSTSTRASRRPGAWRRSSTPRSCRPTASSPARRPTRILACGRSTASTSPPPATPCSPKPGCAPSPPPDRTLKPDAMVSSTALLLRPSAALDQEEFMATFSQSDDLQNAEFRGANLSGARFVECDLSGVVMRGVDIAGSDIDAPWLFEDGAVLRVNGVDVAPFVDAELNRRFPGRAGRRAADPDGLRAAWAAIEHTWAATLERVAAMPAGTVDISVDSEWSFAQTLRHL